MKACYFQILTLVILVAILAPACATPAGHQLVIDVATLLANAAASTATAYVASITASAADGEVTGADWDTAAGAAETAAISYVTSHGVSDIATLGSDFTAWLTELIAGEKAVQVKALTAKGVRAS